MFKNYPPIIVLPQQIADKIASLDGVSLLTTEQASAIEGIPTPNAVEQMQSNKSWMIVSAVW